MQATDQELDSEEDLLTNQEDDGLEANEQAGM